MNFNVVPTMPLFKGFPRVPQLERVISSEIPFLLILDMGSDSLQKEHALPFALADATLFSFFLKEGAWRSLKTQEVLERIIELTDWLYGRDVEKVKLVKETIKRLARTGYLNPIEFEGVQYFAPTKFLAERMVNRVKKNK